MRWKQLTYLADFLQAVVQNSNLIGLVVSLIGTLYMAYDLFGQRHGPLRLLTETITYVVLACIAGTIALGVIAYDAVNYDPYFVQVVTVSGAVSVLVAFGASGGIGAGLTYVLTIERKWNAGKPRIRHDNKIFRISAGLILGIFEGVLVYAVMYNFHYAHDVVTGVRWGVAQGFPAGLMFGYFVATLLIHFKGTAQLIGDGISQADGRKGVEAVDPAQQSSVSAPMSGNDVANSDTSEHSTVERVAASKLSNFATPQRRYLDSTDMTGLTAGVAVGIGVGPVTALSYFALYGSFFAPTFVFITIAGIIGGIATGVLLTTAEPLLVWIDGLPPKRLGIAGALFVVLGFIFQAVQDVIKAVAPFLH